MIYLISIFWFIVLIKKLLFWLYLWQLKEYHIGRFVDHFRTARGQQIFLNWPMGLRVSLLAGFFIYPALLPPALLTIYLLESAKTVLDFLRGTVKKPVFTAKTVFLFCIAATAVMTAAAAALFISQNQLSLFVLCLLLLDILVPLMVSAIVLALQPLAVIGRKRIIEKAKRKRSIFPNLIVVGITGSYGKTSTKEFLAAVLSEKFNVLKTKEHQNSEVGVAQCILNDLKPEHEVFVCEMGAYGRGGIKLLCDITEPKMGILTGINEQHMATFGSQENIIRTKFELLEALPEDGIAVVNWDNQLIKSQITNHKSQTNSKLQISNIKLIKYSTASQEDIWAEHTKVEKQYVLFRGCASAGCADFKVNVLGVHYVPNILAAIAVAKALGMTMAEIAEQCKKITPAVAGMEAKRGINGTTIIGATYSANPDGVISHLEYLKIWPGKKIIIMPCLIELGGASREVHRRIGRKIGEVCDLAIITTEERFSDVKTGAVETGMREENILFLEKPKEILIKLQRFLRTGDMVLFEGRVAKQIITLLTS